MIIHDWMVSGVSIAVFAVALIAIKVSAASVEEDSAEASKKISRELSIQPVFELKHISRYKNHVKFSLENTKNHPVEITSVMHQEDQEDFQFKVNSQEVSCILWRKLEGRDELSLKIKYSVADGREYIKKVNIQEFKYGPYISKQGIQR